MLFRSGTSVAASGRDRRSRFRALRSPRPRGEATHPPGSRPASGGAQAPFDDLSGTTEPHDAVTTPTRKFTRDSRLRCSARGPPNLEALLVTVEDGQKREVKKAWPLRTARANHLPLGEGVPDQKGARVVGGPVDERSGSNPRAHRFQAVESTLAAEQLSPFAGKDGTSVVSSLARFERIGCGGSVR